MFSKNNLYTICLLLIIVFSSLAEARKTIISWSAPTTRTDGQPINSPLKYYVSTGLSSRQYTDKIEVKNYTISGNTMSEEVDLVYSDSEKVYITMTALETGTGRESDYSAEVFRNAISLPPVPQNIEIIISQTYTNLIIEKYELLSFGEDLEDRFYGKSLPNSVLAILEDNHPELTTGEVKATTN